uniref:Secreted protein n=1 Tax=Macrostomum lignano TaxID=282301 RepID=A0A1I8JL02_9PLAT
MAPSTSRPVWLEFSPSATNWAGAAAARAASSRRWTRRPWRCCGRGSKGTGLANTRPLPGPCGCDAATLPQEDISLPRTPAGAKRSGFTSWAGSP